ncbi:amino acid ABC transporter permease [Rhodococcus sp. NPDC055024]
MTTPTAPLIQTQPPSPVEYTIAHKRHVWRWTSAVVLLALVALMLQSVFTNPRFGWETVWMYARDVSILNGLLVTLGLTAICMLIGILLGTVIAVMRLSSNPVARTVAFGYVTFFRGIPVLVQLLLWFNLAALYPTISFGIPGLHLNSNEIVSPMLAAILGLGLNQGAYMSEIVRAGILSVDEGQSRAAAALGITRLHAMRRIILPQAMRVIIPPTGNETIGMLKTTAIVSFIAVPDLLYSTQIISARTFETIPMLMVASIWYLLVTSILAVGQNYLERKFKKGAHRASSSSSMAMLSKFTFFAKSRPTAGGIK